MKDYIAFSFTSSNPQVIRDGRLATFIEQRKHVLNILKKYVCGETIESANEFIFQPNRFILSLMHKPVEWVPADAQIGRFSIANLHEELTYISENLDKIRTDNKGFLLADRPLPGLSQTKLIELLDALEKLADPKRRRACRWVFHFHGQDHLLMLPMISVIRSHKDAFASLFNSPVTDGPGKSKTSTKNTPDKPGGGGRPRFELAGGPAIEKPTQFETLTSQSERSESATIRLVIKKITGKDEFMTPAGETVRVPRGTLSGRKCGDKLLVRTKIAPKTLVDLTDGQIEFEWDELDEGGD
ncbi:MAG: hypothetical protein ACXIUB_03540 [Wenzhouxiangella sp.]